jgi:hypothetical protein
MRRTSLTLLLTVSVICSAWVAATGGARPSETTFGTTSPNPSATDALSPAPSFPDQIGAPYPTVSLLPVVTAEARGSILHVHFDGLVFDMPASWTIRPANVDEFGANRIDAFVGTAPSVAGCYGIAFQSPSVGASSCSFDLRLAPGDVSIALEIAGGGPFRMTPIGDPSTLQSGDRVVSVDGVPAVRNDSVTSLIGGPRGLSLAVQDVADLQTNWLLEAGVRDPGSEKLLSRVEDVFASVHYATRPVLPDDSLSWNARSCRPRSASCARTTPATPASPRSPAPPRRPGSPHCPAMARPRRRST